MLETLYTSIFVALSAIALTVILRNAPIIRGWVFEMKKPWACNICMPLYTCAVVVGGLFYQHRDENVFWAYLPAYTLTFIALEAMSKAPTVVPTFNLEDSE